MSLLHILYLNLSGWILRPATQPGLLIWTAARREARGISITPNLLPRAPER